MRRVTTKICIFLQLLLLLIVVEIGPGRCAQVGLISAETQHRPSAEGESGAVDLDIAVCVVHYADGQVEHWTAA